MHSNVYAFPRHGCQIPLRFSVNGYNCKMESWGSRGVKRGRWGEGGGGLFKRNIPRNKRQKKKKAGVSQNVECGVEIKNGGAAVE